MEQCLDSVRRDVDKNNDKTNATMQRRGLTKCLKQFKNNMEISENHGTNFTADTLHNCDEECSELDVTDEAHPNNIDEAKKQAKDVFGVLWIGSHKRH